MMQHNKRRFTSKHASIGMTHRVGSSDERALKEVIDQHVYRKAKIGFDVEEGETWLDLGANIGSFCAYAILRGASHVEAYEPDPSCFNLLEMNMHDLPVTCHNTAVSASESPTLQFWKGRSDSDFYRGSVTSAAKPHPCGTVRNIHPSSIPKKRWSGIKMDIEGAEFDLLDLDLLPKSEKLVMEYHIIKDRSMVNFHRRMNKLRERYVKVDYIKSLDRGYPNDEYPGKFDRIVFCMGRK